MLLCPIHRIPGILIIPDSSSFIVKIGESEIYTGCMIYRPVARLAFEGCILGKSGLFRVLFGRKGTFSCAFPKKVNIFTHIVGESEYFCALFGRKWVI